MKQGLSAKSLLIAFGAVIVLYFAGFYGIEHLRHRKGPWEVRFGTGPNGVPFAEISQPALRISEVKLAFPGETSTNAAQTVRFERPTPGTAVPFGRVIYEDLTFLPGVVTLDLYGHEVELLPRTLILNRKSVPWRSGAVIELSRDGKPSKPPQPPAARER